MKQFLPKKTFHTKIMKLITDEKEFVIFTAVVFDPYGGISNTLGITFQIIFFDDIYDDISPYLPNTAPSLECFQERNGQRVR